MPELSFGVELSVQFLTEAVESAKVSDHKVEVNWEALKTVLDAYKAGLAECDRITAEYNEHQRPKDLSWYMRDEESDRLSERDDAADDIRRALTGKES